VYLHADTEIKKDALDKTKPPHVIAGTYTPPADILTRLEALRLCRQDPDRSGPE